MSRLRGAREALPRVSSGHRGPSVDSVASTPRGRAGPLRVLAEVLARPSVVPPEPGVYGRHFDTSPHPDLPARTLLYVGIAPRRMTTRTSAQQLRTRVRYHYRGNAEGSTPTSPPCGPEPARWPENSPSHTELRGPRGRHSSRVAAFSGLGEPRKCRPPMARATSAASSRRRAGPGRTGRASRTGGGAGRVVDDRGGDQVGERLAPLGRPTRLRTPWPGRAATAPSRPRPGRARSCVLAEPSAEGGEPHRGRILPDLGGHLRQYAFRGRPAGEHRPPRPLNGQLMAGRGSDPSHAAPFLITQGHPMGRQSVQMMPTVARARR